MHGLTLVDHTQLVRTLQLPTSPGSSKNSFGGRDGAQSAQEFAFPRGAQEQEAVAEEGLFPPHPSTTRGGALRRHARSGALRPLRISLTSFYYTPATCQVGSTPFPGIIDPIYPGGTDVV